MLGAGDGGSVNKEGSLQGEGAGPRNPREGR